MRKKVIAGNWKMNMLPNETIAFLDTFTPLVANFMRTIYGPVLCIVNCSRN